MLKLILADNQAIFRAGIAKVLAVEDEMRIVAQVQDVERNVPPWGDSLPECDSPQASRETHCARKPQWNRDRALHAACQSLLGSPEALNRSGKGTPTHAGEPPANPRVKGESRFYR